jgi:hypothetical protein
VSEHGPETGPAVLAASLDDFAVRPFPHVSLQEKIRKQPLFHSVAFVPPTNNSRKVSFFPLTYTRSFQDHSASPFLGDQTLDFLPGFDPEKGFEVEVQRVISHLPYRGLEAREALRAFQKEAFKMGISRAAILEVLLYMQHPKKPFKFAAPRLTAQPPYKSIGDVGDCPLPTHLTAQTPQPPAPPDLKAPLVFDKRVHDMTADLIARGVCWPTAHPPMCFPYVGVKSEHKSLVIMPLNQANDLQEEEPPPLSMVSVRKMAEKAHALAADGVRLHFAVCDVQNFFYSLRCSDRFFTFGIKNQDGTISSFMTDRLVFGWSFSPFLAQTFLPPLFENAAGEPLDLTEHIIDDVLGASRELSLAKKFKENFEKTLVDHNLIPSPKTPSEAYSQGLEFVGKELSWQGLGCTLHKRAEGLHILLRTAGWRGALSEKQLDALLGHLQWNASHLKFLLPKMQPFYFLKHHQQFFPAHPTTRTRLNTLVAASWKNLHFGNVISTTLPANDNPPLFVDGWFDKDANRGYVGIVAFIGGGWKDMTVVVPRRYTVSLQTTELYGIMVAQNCARSQKWVQASIGSDSQSSIDACVSGHVQCHQFRRANLLARILHNPQISNTAQKLFKIGTEDNPADFASRATSRVKGKFFPVSTTVAAQVAEWMLQHPHLAHFSPTMVL